MSDLELLPVLAAVAAAAVLAVMAIRSALALRAPPANEWRDPAPLGWRLAGPAIRPLATAIDPLLPARWRVRQARALRQAGLDMALEPSEVAAGVLIGAAVLGLGVAMSIDALPGPIREDAASRRALIVVAAILCGAWLPSSWLRARRTARIRAISRALPFYLDLVTLCVESGTTVTGALQHAVAKGPPGPLRGEIERVLRDIRTGRGRTESLRAFADRLDLPAVSSWVAALVAAERHGSGLGPILRAQAEQRRQERFQQAEKLAMRAPVKMLFPLMAFIFPCTFVLLFFPVVVRLIEEGLLR